MSCDLNVFANGHFLVDLTQQPGPMPLATLDTICQRLTAATDGKVVFDWHPIGGRPQLLYLGDHALAKSTFLAASAWIRETADAYADQWYAANPDMRPSGFRSDLGLPDGPKISEAGMITIGQAMHRDRRGVKQ